MCGPEVPPKGKRGRGTEKKEGGIQGQGEQRDVREGGRNERGEKRKRNGGEGCV